MKEDGKAEGQLFLWIAFLVFFVVVLPCLYSAYAKEINTILLGLAKMELMPFTFMSDKAAIAYVRISELDPAALQWEMMQRILHYSGTWIRWPFAIILALFGVASIMLGSASKLTRHFNMSSLLKNNADTFPCLKPIVGRGEYLLSPDSYDSGLWRVARTPVQFALKNSILLEKPDKPFRPQDALKHGLPETESQAYGQAVFDENRAESVLQEQLGKKYSGFTGLSSCRKALASAFLAYAGGDKKLCVSMLDEISNSYNEENNEAKCPMLEEETFIKRINDAWEKHKVILEEKSISIHSAYELPWFMALLCRARKKGVLATSQFIWLRPMDRSLWYALNQCGGRAAWAEGFASWAHFKSEEQAGKCLVEPQISSAVTSLKQSLDAQGWLTDSFKQTPENGQSPEDEQSKQVDDQAKQTDEQAKLVQKSEKPTVTLTKKTDAEIESMPSSEDVQNSDQVAGNIGGNDMNTVISFSESNPDEYNPEGEDDDYDANSDTKMNDEPL